MSKEPEWHDEVGQLEESLRTIRAVGRDIKEGVKREVRDHRDRRAERREKN